WGRRWVSSEVVEVDDVRVSQPGSRRWQAVRRGGLVLVLGLVAVIGLIVGALALTGRRDGGPLTVVPTCGTSLASPCPSPTSDRDAAGQATATISSVPGPGVLAVHVSGNRLVDAAGSTLQLHGVNRSGTEYQ